MSHFHHAIVRTDEYDLAGRNQQSLFVYFRRVSRHIAIEQPAAERRNHTHAPLRGGYKQHISHVVDLQLIEFTVQGHLGRQFSSRIESQKRSLTVAE